MTIFEKIIAGQIPCHKIYEDAEHLAFLDIRPVAPGHTLVIPKAPMDQVFQLSDQSYSRLMVTAKKVAEILKAKVPCQRVCMAVVGFEVPHAHVHLIPARGMSDFPWPGGHAASGDELALIRKQICGD